ncbi:MAG: hypothetical protein ACK2UM_12695 [Anaerolineales bacterium]|jgi:hypothetical protein
MQKVEIRVKGYMDADWSEWFEGFEISKTEGGETIIRGEAQDQSALYGLIAKLRDLGLTLVSVNEVN